VAITYVNSAKFPTSYPGAGNNIDTVTIAKPTNTAQNDVMVAFILTVSGAAMTTVPSGWTLYDSVDNGSNLKLWIYRKVAGGSEGSSYVWTDDSGAIGPMCGLISAWRGCNTTTPLAEGNSATTTTTDPVTTPSVTTTLLQNLMLHFAASRTTNNVATQGTYTNAAGQTERMNPANRGASTEYYAELSNLTAMTHVGAGSQAGVTFDSDVNHAPSNGIQYQLALVADYPVVTANAGAVAATAAAYDAGTAVSTTSAFAAATATAYNATVQTGVAAENTGFGAATVTAYNAAGWVIHPVNVGVQAFDASVAITTEAGYAAASVAVGSSVGYFGAPESRRWKIPPEDRSWAIQPETRSWNIPPED
jgi:hypothetical protein